MTKEKQVQRKLLVIVPGGGFQFSGVSWTALEHDESGGTLCIATCIVSEKLFSESVNNDWREAVCESG